MRICLILNPKLLRFARRPRSKKLRIIRKWRKRPENWGPLMVPVGHRVVCGSMAHMRAIPADPTKERFRETIEMHPALWEYVQRVNPEFVAQCALHRYEDVVRDGITWRETVPIG